MTTSIVDRETQLGAGPSSITGDSVRLTVTGVDQSGQMFRENAAILSLDVRDCRFRSKFSPELSSWVLLELDFVKTNKRYWTQQGRVKSVQADGSVPSLFAIQVELETNQDLKLAATPQISSSKSQKQPSSGESSTPKPEQASVKMPQEADLKSASQAGEQPIHPVNRIENPPSKPAVSGPPAQELALLTQEEQPSLPSPARKSTMSIDASNLTNELEALRNSLAKELQRMVQAAVTPTIEARVRELIDRQISTNYQATIQALNSDLVHQFAGHLAKNGEVLSVVESVSKGVVEAQMDHLRKTAMEAKASLDNQAAELTLLRERFLSEMEAKSKAAHGEIQDALAKVPHMDNETAHKLHETMEQLNSAARTTVEKFDGHVTSQLNSWSLQFKNYLDATSKEKTAQFGRDLEKQMTPQLLKAGEILEKLSAGLQLGQGTIRLQEERLAELTRTASAAFEKDIKAVLLRLANTNIF